MKKIHWLLFLVILCAKAQENQGVTHSNQKTGQPPFPTETFTELPNPVATSPEKWLKINRLQIGWGTTDIRYKKEEPSQNLEQKAFFKAWKGERVSGQIVISNGSKTDDFSVEVSDLKHVSKNKILLKKENISADFLRFVMTDELNKDKKGGCGYRKLSDFDSTLVADAIDHLAKKIQIVSRSTRGVWVKINVPQDAVSGIYKGFISVKNRQKVIKKLPFEIEILDRILPQSKNWTFHLDLWQNPYAVARYFNVKPWSSAHFEKLKTEMKPYVEAGGKSITASIMYKPWGGQTYDAFNSMVMWIKKLDGSWYFDFAVFDKWVEFMMQLGINKQINCYSMVPWKLSFQYFDQATNSLQVLETKPGTPEYEEMWVSMLKAFSKHLKQKGWFEKTYISMDERPMEVMKETFKIIKKADPNFKVSLAGDWHKELEPNLDDYCVPLSMKYDKETLARRKEQGKVTTYYTCCTEAYPNTFTFSQPAESEWLAWYAAKDNLDGYLRWALNSWTLEPLLDSRFTAWAAGDTYLTYPMGRSSVRMERLIEGIQFYEKIKILRNEFEKNGNKKGLEQINEVLSTFDEKTLPENPASEVTKKARNVINSL